MVRPTTRQLVVTADDYGLTTATAEAIVTAHRQGIVTATSVLGNGPATVATLSLLEGAPDLEVGAHVALVGEDPPVAPAVAIPTLVDRRGRFRPSWRRLVVDLGAGRVDPADVRRELAAQLEVVASGGRPITHLNLHQHLQLWPVLRAPILEAAAAHGIGFVRRPWSEARGPTGVVVRRLARSLGTDLAAAGLATSDGFVGLDGAGSFDGRTLRDALAHVAGDVVEVNLHPGAIQDGERHRYRWAYRWADELAACTDPRSRSAVAAAGFALVGPSSVTRQHGGRA
ncbi:ChbG/HpnK family deacetylase [Aquihabitans sp. G128]|uniref:carbohydrate deacetylase n=1 Tax=Aquihabitans sp. G128 TaxID=2849779 RepID=UPI001C237605|nr:ChbG/HpnK family deacetylase [Aquihabitans sp. G128]QXC60286.1 ChbG/HpnK family deacetylase [Aquihabitans sp. G128]